MQSIPIDPLYLIVGSSFVNLLERYHTGINVFHTTENKLSSSLMEDSLKIMDAYRVFLITVFDDITRIHLCSQAIQNQVMALYKGEALFHAYIKAHPNKFFSALNDKFQMSCHPEFLLNKRYHNDCTKLYAKLWDKIYSEIDFLSVILINVPKPGTSLVKQMVLFHLSYLKELLRRGMLVPVSK